MVRVGPLQLLGAVTVAVTLPLDAPCSNEPTAAVTAVGRSLSENATSQNATSQEIFSVDLGSTRTSMFFAWAALFGITFCFAFAALWKYRRGRDNDWQEPRPSMHGFPDSDGSYGLSVVCTSLCLIAAVGCLVVWGGYVESTEPPTPLPCADGDCWADLPTWRMWLAWVAGLGLCFLSICIVGLRLCGFGFCKDNDDTVGNATYWIALPMCFCSGLAFLGCVIAWAVLLADAPPGPANVTAHDTSPETANATAQNATLDRDAARGSMLIAWTVLLGLAALFVLAALLKYMLGRDNDWDDPRPAFTDGGLYTVLVSVASLFFVAGTPCLIGWGAYVAARSELPTPLACADGDCWDDFTTWMTWLLWIAGLSLCFLSICIIGLRCCGFGFCKDKHNKNGDPNATYCMVVPMCFCAGLAFLGCVIGWATMLANAEKAEPIIARLSPAPPPPPPDGSPKPPPGAAPPPPVGGTSPPPPDGVSSLSTFEVIAILGLCLGFLATCVGIILAAYLILRNTNKRFAAQQHQKFAAMVQEAMQEQGPLARPNHHRSLPPRRMCMHVPRVPQKTRKRRTRSERRRGKS